MNQKTTRLAPSLSSKMLTGFLLLLEKSAPVALTNQNRGSRHKRFGKVLWKQLSRKLIRWRRGLLWRSSEIRLLPLTGSNFFTAGFNVSNCKSRLPTFHRASLPPYRFSKSFLSTHLPPPPPRAVLWLFHHALQPWTWSMRICSFALSMTHHCWARHSFKIL